MGNHYVILTGSKNNAGDFLIKYRAKQLFKHIRPDREVIDYNAWEYLDDEKLKIVNDSKALILMGGPALQKNTYPGIYRLRDNLDDIKVPIIMMGIGWYSPSGEWSDTHYYPMNITTLNLLEKIGKNNFLNSVRDYHTLNTLQIKGYKNILMTGCPAYYDLEYLNKKFYIPQNIEKIAFSLGVSFVLNPKIENIMKNNILSLRDYFEDKKFEVVFHHSLNKEESLKYNGVSEEHNKKHLDFAKWLEKNNIKYVDISGSAKKLIDYYSNVDLHIGYRVHAHIFMNSISKPSILVAEDGRGIAVKDVIGGVVLKGYKRFKNSLIEKVLRKLNLSKETLIESSFLTQDIVNNMVYELNQGMPRLSTTRYLIDKNFEVMKIFLKQLP